MKPTFIYYINISVYNITHTQTHTRLIDPEFPYEPLAGAG